MDYSYEQPHLVARRFVEGNVNEVDGEFVLEDLGDGTTLATCGVRIDAGASLSCKAAAALNEQVTRWALEDLKSRVERGA